MAFGLKDESTGTTCEIDSFRRMSVKAVTESEIGRVSQDTQSSFVIYGKRNFAAAATNENILFLKYTGSKSLKISSITFSSDSANAKCELYYDAVYTSGGTALSTDVNILNQNRQSSKPLDVTAYHGGTTLVMAVDANFEALDVRLAHSTHRQSFDGLILGKNDTLGILGEVGVIAERIRVMVECYEV